MDRIIAANWKMNKTAGETREFFVKLRKLLSAPGKRLGKSLKDRIIVICPPFTAMAAARKGMRGLRARLGSQDIYFEKNGAYTGEISAEMLAEFGTEFVIVGHSERRKYFRESNRLVNKKLLAVLENGMVPILCVGETGLQRKKGIQEKVVGRQLKECLEGVSHGLMQKVVIAYEPLWAIGTGKNASPEEAAEMHAMIRGVIEGIFGKPVAKKVFILYGGSVNKDNAAGLSAMKGINGFLIGGASLDAKHFVDIIKKP